MSRTGSTTVATSPTGVRFYSTVMMKTTSDELPLPPCVLFHPLISGSGSRSDCGLPDVRIEWKRESDTFDLRTNNSKCRNQFFRQK